MILFFDTETTDKIRYGIMPRLVQLAYLMVDTEQQIASESFIIRPEGFHIPLESTHIHGITTEQALADGKCITDVLNQFANAVNQAHLIVAHNIDFDKPVMESEFVKAGLENPFLNKKVFCTMSDDRVMSYCGILKEEYHRRKHGGYYKFPSLKELYRKLFGKPFNQTHNALDDVTATKECYFKLVELGIIPNQLIVN